ncbi:unnamed protein product, partial [Discosporangium mesarthrocarpum]
LVFETGLDCRVFAAGVLKGLGPLLAQLGPDILQRLAESGPLALESEEVVMDINDMLCHARGDGGGAGVGGGAGGGVRHAMACPDDIVIVQNVGTPFATMMWQEEYSSATDRYSAERILFQNRQECVDRFGNLLRDYQGARKGLHKGPGEARRVMRWA